jgi:hypothetical protein
MFHSGILSLCHSMQWTPPWLALPTQAWVVLPVLLPGQALEFGRGRSQEQHVTPHHHAQAAQEFG